MAGGEHGPLTADLQILAGQLEPVVRPNHRLDPALTVRRGRIRQQDADAGMLASPDPAAQP